MCVLLGCGGAACEGAEEAPAPFDCGRGSGTDTGACRTRAESPVEPEGGRDATDVALACCTRAGLPATAFARALWAKYDVREFACGGAAAAAEDASGLDRLVREC